MKVKKMRVGYALRLNDSEFAALVQIVDYGCDEARKLTTNKRGFSSFDAGLKVTEDRRNDPSASED